MEVVCNLEVVVMGIFDVVNTGSAHVLSGSHVQYYASRLHYSKFSYLSLESTFAPRLV